MTDPRVDERYYQATPPRSLGERLIVAARDRIYDDFVRLCVPTPETTILDVGVSDVINDGANLLERRYPHPQRISAAGLGEGADFRAAFPAVRYTQIEPNAPLPYPDDAFDIAVSNAVIEHTGSPENQAAFVAEMGRVARTVFLTAPNRFFPVEHHTAIPLFHYWRPSFTLAAKALGKEEWLDPKALILIGKSRLTELAPNGLTGYTGLRLGPFSSNLYLHLKRQP